MSTIQVFEYYSEISNGPNTNNTIQCILFEYQIIWIICSNSGLKGLGGQNILSTEGLKPLEPLPDDLFPANQLFFTVSPK